MRKQLGLLMLFSSGIHAYLSLLRWFDRMVLFLSLIHI